VLSVNPGYSLFGSIPGKSLAPKKEVQRRENNRAMQLVLLLLLSIDVGKLPSNIHEPQNDEQVHRIVEE
jgi:hypothetical protein